MTTLIQFKRGNLGNLGGVTPLDGEPIFTQDVNRLHIGDGGVKRVMGVLYALDQTTAPTASDDAADGFSVGSVWVDTTGDRTYVCLDSTPGQALWRETTTTPVTGAEWRWDANNTTMADPGAARVRANTLPAASVTALAISTTPDAAAIVPGTSASAIMTALLSSLRAGDHLYIQSRPNPATLLRYSLTANPTNNTTWFQLSVSLVAGGTLLPNEGDRTSFLFLTAGAGLITAVADTPTVDLAVSSGTLSAAVLAQMSIDNAAALKLVNDAASPGNNKLYGTDPAGAKGWYDQPTKTNEAVWRYDATSTAMADPGAGKLRTNAAPGSATAIAISKTTDPGADVANFLRSLAQGDGVYIQDKNNSVNWARYTLSAAPIDNTTWFQLPLTLVSSAGVAPSNNSPLAVVFSTAGGGGGGGGGTTILDGAGAPTGSTGALGDYYEDTDAGVLYGPKIAASPEERPTVNHAPNVNSAGVFTQGARYRFAVAGNIVRVRYQRTAASANTLVIKVYNNDAAGALLASVDDTRPGLAGAFEVALPSPVAVGVNAIRTVALYTSVSGNPYYNAAGGCASTTNVTFLAFTDISGNAFPSGTTSGLEYPVEPVFVPGANPWPRSVREIPPVTSTTGGQAPASGGGTVNFLRADATWQPPVAANGITNAMLRDSVGVSVIGRSANSTGDPADIAASADGQVLTRTAGALLFATPPAAPLDINGLTAADVALLDNFPIYDVSASANRKATISHVGGVLATAPGGRLTLWSGDPTGEASGATVYYCPYLHDRIDLWDGTRWVTVDFVETSFTFSGANPAGNYDIHAFLSSGALALEPSGWSSNTSRGASVPISLQDGRYCLSSDKRRLFLGTLRWSGTSIFDGDQNRFLWNMYNRVLRYLRRKDGTTSWTYTLSAYRAANGNIQNFVACVRGLDAEPMFIVVQHYGLNSGAAVVLGVGIGLDRSDGNDAYVGGGIAPLASQGNQVYAMYAGKPGLGYHYFYWLEKSGLTTGTTSWYTSIGGGDIQSGMYGWGWF